MTPLALALVLCAAALHATWNLISKRAGGGALPFVYLVGVINLALYAPFIAGFCLWKHPSLSVSALVWMAGSGVLKTGYALYLQRSYRIGDFSLVYPVARGTGPVVAMAAAVLFTGERPGPIAVVGGLVIVASIFVLAGGARLFGAERARLRPVFRLGMTSGLFIAGYTLWDRHGVAALGIPPLLYDAGTTLTGVVLLSPFAMGRQAEMAEAWRTHRLAATGVAALSSLAYILILTALAFTPVSYVAPAREVSIVIGTFMGSRVLKEAEGRRRIWAAAAIAAGILALAIG